MYGNPANMARLLRSQVFEKPRFIHRHLGFNYRMTDIQAAIACAQLEKINQEGFTFPVVWEIIITKKQRFSFI